jgi:hypothetical protein
MNREEKIQEVAARLVKELANEGQLVAGGWYAFEKAFLPPHIGEQQRNDMMVAFYSGAEHTFYNMISMQDEGEEPTDADMARMDKLHAELERFQNMLREVMGLRTKQ